MSTGAQFTDVCMGNGIHTNTYIHTVRTYVVHHTGFIVKVNCLTVREEISNTFYGTCYFILNHLYVLCINLCQDTTIPYVYANVLANLHTNSPTILYVHKYMHACVRTYKLTNYSIHTYIRTYLRTCMRAYVHTNSPLTRPHPHPHPPP